LVLPGGMPGTLNLGASRLVQEKIKKFQEEGKWLAAICAAPSVLGQAGLLKGKEAVCYPGFEDKLLEAKVCYEPVKVDGHILTSRGMGTAIDFGLAIIEQLLSGEKAEEIRKSILYRI
jgi:4-methyl-5(b-hydroxyethyl)-thiazole monophosphate biosynthesis